MADFVALTPPLSQQPWAAIPVLVYAAGVNTPGNFVEVNPILLGFGAGVTLEDFGYPPLSAPFRVRILKKYPGTIFPDPRLQDAIPCPKPDRFHIWELWNKYNDVLDSGDDLPPNLPAYIEREVAEWIAEYDASRGTAVFIPTDRPIMAKSKKHAQGDNCKGDAIRSKVSRVTKATKKSSALKKKSPSLRFTKLLNKSPSQKEHYDKAFPAHIVVHKDSPAYIMAQTYITTYAKSHEKYSRRLQEMISNQGIEPVIQRCAKFFAWGLKQPIRTASGEAEFAEMAEDMMKFCNNQDDDEEIINVRPGSKPSFQFKESALGGRVGSFLDELKASNDQLEADMAAGVNHSMEVNESDSADEVIEMNLGLGVLEEKAHTGEEDSEQEEEKEAAAAEKKVLIEEL